MSTRPVPVPERLTIAFVVLTADPLDRDDLVPLPERTLLRLRGSSIADLDRMTRLPHQRLVSATLEAAQVRGAWNELRREALALADEHDGLVLDLQIPRVVTGSPDDPAPNAVDWFSFEYDPERPEDIRTHGLAVLGLPEIVVHGVPEDRRPMYDMVVVGLVQRLLEEWPENDPVGPAHVTIADIAAGYEGDLSPAPGAQPGVGVLIDYDADDHVLVAEVVDDPRSALFGGGPQA
jgi:hypothetical protein